MSSAEHSLVLPITAVTAEKVWGDINGDGRITNEDITLLVRYPSGLDVEISFIVSFIKNRDL